MTQTLTANGDKIVELIDSDEGDCAYCGDVVYGRTAVTESGMRQAAPGSVLVWRWFRKEFELWHIDCLTDWTFAWTQNANGTVHIEGCRHAESGGKTYQGTRGEARHMLGDRFCKRCAPIERWYA